MTPRPDIRMTAEEIDAFLAEQTVAVIAAVDPEGWPVGAVGRVQRVDGLLDIDLPPFDALVEAIRDGGPICCVFEDSPTYHTIRGVTIRGRVRRRDPQLEVEIERTTSFDFGKLPRSER